MKMNVLILVAIFLLGSCTESPLEMEQEDEIFSDTRSGISPIDEALANLKTTRLGGPLLTYASLRCPAEVRDRIYFYFQYPRTFYALHGDGVGFIQSE